VVRSSPPSAGGDALGRVREQLLARRVTDALVDATTDLIERG
jgi:hypothetical protein